MFSLSNLTCSGTISGRVNWFISQNVNGLEQVWTAVWQERHPGVVEIDGHISISVSI